ncbi:WXG100 family type VII secretion target [Kitasatospora sp. NPDC018058]|uniref:WXG100 family type VII secretion target n=1 Tax=Kitasatospora sp. NPDC018058 TaxID=3364025 RepID=UPI0037C06B7E
MPTYTVNFSNVQHVAEEMQAISQNIKTTLASLDTNARQHLAEWTSEAQSAYAAAKARWDAASADMAAQAAKAQGALTEIHAGYAQAERAGSNMWCH